MVKKMQRYGIKWANKMETKVSKHDFNLEKEQKNSSESNASRTIRIP